MLLSVAKDGYLNNRSKTTHCTQNYLINCFIVCLFIDTITLLGLETYLLAGRTPMPQTSQQESLMITLSKFAIKNDCVKIAEAFKFIFPKFYFVPTR